MLWWSLNILVKSHRLRPRDFIGVLIGGHHTITKKHHRDSYPLYLIGDKRYSFKIRYINELIQHFRYI